MQSWLSEETRSGRGFLPQGCDTGMYSGSPYLLSTLVRIMPCTLHEERKAAMSSLLEMKLRVAESLLNATAFLKGRTEAAF